MKFKIPLEIRENGSFHDLIFIKSKKYNIAFDTGTYFCISAVTPLHSSKERDIPYLLGGDKMMGKMSCWDVDLISEEDITIPNVLIGLHVQKIPNSEVGYWDFLVGMMFMRGKKFHLDVDCLGGLKEGWIEVDYEK
jgi:hypothetical protein